MGIKFGEIDAVQILDNEYRSKLALRLIDWSFAHLGQRPSSQQITEIKNEVVRELQLKYPNSGITLQD